MKKTVIILLSLLLIAQAMAQTNDTIRLSVKDCIELALENNIPLKNSQLRVEEARLLKKEARSAYFPKASAQAFAFDAVNPLFGLDFNNTLPIANKGVAVNAFAVEPVFTGGRIINGNKMAALGIEAAEYQSKIVEDEICIQVESIYWQIVSLHEKIVTLDRLDQLLDTLSKDLDGAIEAGLFMPTDRYKLTIKQNESQLNRKKVEDGIALLKMTLAEYIGTDWKTMMLTDTIGIPTPPTSFFQSAPEAVARRNETQLLNLSVQVEKLKKKMTIGTALPSLMVGGSATYHNLLKENKTNALVFAMLQVPIFDPNLMGSKIKKDNLSAKIAENNRDSFTKLMTLQTEQAWFSLEQSWLRINMAQSSLNDAEANLKVTKDYYDAGLVSLSDLLEAQTLFQHSRDELSDSRVEYQINLMKYKQLTKM